jgi:molecular chaperone GrpE
MAETDAKEKEIKNTEPEKVSSDKKSEAQKSKGGTKKSNTKSGKKVNELEKKIETLEQEKSAMDEENKTLRDQLLRKAAEFDNYKRRTEKEFISLLDSANEELILDILPAIDDFERSLQHMEESENNDSHSEGIRLIYKKLISTLEKKGLKPMDAIGQEFDPDQHQALMQVDSDKYESGTVVEEHLKGYKLNEKVIRHSQVLVAK